MAEHVRIDEGQKRGPRIRQGKLTRPSDKADLGSWQIPPTLDPHEVNNRYLTEPTTAHIARQYGLSRKALVKWIRQQLPTEWKEAQILRALCRKEDSEDGLDRAVNSLSLQRAREQLRGSQFDLERLDSGTWGQKQEITHTIIPVLVINTSAIKDITPIAVPVLAVPDKG